MILRFFQSVGVWVLGAVTMAGRGSLMLWLIFRSLGKCWKLRREIYEQMHIVAVGSLPLVATTAVFTGGITAVQTGYQMQGFVPLVFLGTVITKGVILEMGPVLAALVVGSRLAASYAAELGTMKVTEQLDAMEIMAIEPVEFLGLPRFVAAVLMMPVVTAIADFIAIMGGLVVSMMTLDVTPQTFAEGAKFFFQIGDLVTGLGKPFFFGGIIAMAGMYFGFNTRGGAEGVGRATMQAVVASCVSVLVADYILGTIFLQIIFAE